MGGLLEKLAVDVDWEGAGTGLWNEKFLHPEDHRGRGRQWENEVVRK